MESHGIIGRREEFYLNSCLKVCLIGFTCRVFCQLSSRMVFVSSAGHLEGKDRLDYGGGGGVSHFSKHTRFFPIGRVLGYERGLVSVQPCHKTQERCHEDRDPCEAHHLDVYPMWAELYFNCGMNHAPNYICVEGRT